MYYGFDSLMLYSVLLRVCMINVYLFLQTSLSPLVDSMGCLNQSVILTVVGVSDLVLEIASVYHGLQKRRLGGTTKKRLNVKRLTWIHRPTITRVLHGRRSVRFWECVGFPNRLSKSTTHMFKVCTYVCSYVNIPHLMNIAVFCMCI